MGDHRIRLTLRVPVLELILVVRRRRYGGPAYEGNEGCKIEWLPGKDVTKQEIEKKQRKKKGKGAGEVRVVKRIVPQKSFFSFFDSLPPMPEEEPTSAKEEEVRSFS